MFVLFFAYSLFLAAPHLTGGDCGEYVTAGAYLGNTHPPGNPVYHMTSYLAQRIPFADAYGRSVALSCLAAAGAVGILCRILLGAGAGAVPSISFSLLLGFSPVVIRNALVTEVYTLLLCFVAAFTLISLSGSWDDPAVAKRRTRLLAFLAGTGMAIHYLSLFHTAPLVAYGWVRGGRKASGLGHAALLFLCGFLSMLYLPARAAAHPPANFGDPSSLGNLLDALTWKMYASRAIGERDVLLLLRQSGWTLESLLRSVASPVIPLALAGLLSIRASRGPAVVLPICVFLALAGNVILQNFPSRILTLSEMPRFLGPASFPIYLLAGYGADRLFGMLRAGIPGRKTPPGPAHVLMASLLALLVGITGWTSASRYSRSGDFVVRDYLRDGFLDLPPNAAIVLDKDTQVFGGLATHFVERLRTDLLPIDRTGSHLASIYEFEHAPERITEEYLAEKEEAFLRSYTGDVAFVSLPDWATLKLPWEEYGRLYLAKRGPRSDYFFPGPGGVRRDLNAESSYDVKTKYLLKDALFQDLLRAPLSPDRREEEGRRILRVAWDDPSAYVLYGRILASSERVGEAESAFRHALDVDPAFVEAKRRLGVLLARSRRLPEAVPILLDPKLDDFGEGQFYAGNHFSHAGRHEEAERRYRRAIALGYRTAPLLNNLAVALARLGRVDDARRSWEEALALDPSYEPARANLVKSSKNGPEP